MNNYTVNKETEKSPLEQIAKFLTDGNEKPTAIQMLTKMGQLSSQFEQIDEVIKCLFRIKCYREAATLYPKLLKTAPSEDHTLVAKSNMVNVYNHMNYPETALEIIQELEAKLPYSVDTQLEKAFSYFLMNDKKKAELILRKLRTNTGLTDEQKTTIDFNLGTYDMLNGDLQQGLRRFLFDGEKLKFWNYKTFFNQEKNDYGIKRWDGVVTPGLKLVIVAEAGIGDEIINVRFVKRLQESDVEVAWLAMKERKDLGNIFKRNIPGLKVVYSLDELENKSEWLQSAASMHLPIWLNCQYEDLWHGPYLPITDPLCDKKWQWIKNDIPAIGLRWQGNSEYDHDLHRNVHLADIIKTIDMRCDLFSLQRDSGVEEVEQFKHVTDLSSQLLTLDDTMSIIGKLDLVITSCTSIAHLSNAMGKETCVLVPISAYYTWTQPGFKSHWYGDNCHLFYQTKPRSWDEPLAQLKSFISQWKPK